jgi:hypothetical protein
MVEIEVSLADIYNVAEEIQRFCRKDGYFGPCDTAPQTAAEAG